MQEILLLKCGRGEWSLIITNYQFQQTLSENHEEYPIFRLFLFNFYQVIKNKLTGILIFATMSKSSKYHLEDGVVLMHEGSKAFWQTRTNVEVVLALHSKQDCIEVIIIDSDNGTDFKRFYLNPKLLQSKLDLNDYNKKLSERKEAFLRQKKSFDAQELSSQVRNTMIGQYVISRLSIIKDLVSGSKIVGMKPNYGDVTTVSEEGETLDVIIEQPTDLEVVRVVQTKKAS